MANPYGNHNEPGRPVNAFNGQNHLNGNSRQPPPPPPPPPAESHSYAISTEWTAEEQAILEENLARYATETNISRYSKIAVLLQNKAIRDVALRCRWMSKKENSKRRKEDLNVLRKSKERKEKGLDPSSRSSRLAAIGGPTGHLLRQNAQALEQISANFRSYQMHENIGLFCQARDNILQILNNLRETQDIMKQMPPLPVSLNEELTNLLPPTRFPVETMARDHPGML